MGRYNFVSPAGDSDIFQQIMQREMLRRQFIAAQEERARQKMLDERAGQQFEMQKKQFESGQEQQRFLNARLAEQDRIAADERTRLRGREQDVRGVQGIMGAIYGSGPMNEERVRSLKQTSLSEGIDLPGIIKTDVERFQNPQRHMLTVPGPRGEPTAKMFTEDEIGAGIQTYRAPVQGPQPRYSTLVSPTGEQRQVTEGSQANALMAQGWTERTGSGAGAAAAQERKEKDRSIATERQTIRELAQSLIDDPDLDNITGPVAGGLPDWTYIGHAVDTISRYNQLVKKLELTGRGQLKGQGAISEYEAKGVAAAATAMNR